MATDELISRTADLLWMGGLAASPLALLVGCVCRCKSLRPSTRHMLWFAVLASFVTPMLGAMIWRPQWFRSDSLIAAADSVLSNGPATDPSAIKPASPEASTPAAVGMNAARQPTTPVEPAFPSARRDGIKLEPLGITTPPARALDFTANLGLDERPSQSVHAGVLSGVDDAAHEVPTMTTGSRVDPFAVTAEPALNPRRDILSRDRAFVSADSDTRVSGPVEAPGATIEREASHAAMTPPVPSAVSTEPSASPIAAAAGSSWADVRAWLVRLLNVRDAIAELPRVPGVVWVGGALLLVTISLVRTLLAGRWVKRAVPADASVQASVRQVGDALGLSRTPQAYFVDAAVSPMIWCGWKTRLILPERLWRTLDADARRAVLVHELAHVRRGDHLVCWVQAAIGAIYWWHPVVWWARKRLHDEAEASCDAWVTSLFPRHRRAYASALLVTTSYISLNERQGGPWLGVVSKSAKRLARRITMVMTERSAPGKSVIGVCVATLILTAGTFVMPGLACPPEKEAKDVAATKEIRVLASDGRTAVIVPGQPTKNTQKGAGKARGGKLAEPDVTFFGEAPALDAMREGVTVEGRALAPRSTGSLGQTAPLATQPARAPRAPKAPTAPLALTVPGEPLAELKVVPGQPLLRDSISVPGQPLAREVQGQLSVPAGMEHYTVGRTAREYTLPEDKLDSFYCFMSRDDVPILVQRTGGGIIIWANDSEHAVFEKFIGIVGGTPKAGVLAPAQDPLGATQERYRALAQAEAARAQGKAAKDSAQRYREMLREIESSRDAFERDTERAREEAETARDRAEELRELAMELETRAASLSAEERAELEVASKRLHTRSEALESQAEALEKRVEALERMLEQAEERAEALEERLNELESESVDPAMNDEAEAPAAPEAAEAPDAAEAPEAPEVEPAAPAPAPASASVPVPAASPSPAPAPVPAPNTSAI